MCCFQCTLRFHHHFALFQDTSRRYENKAGSFITGIDVTSKVIFVLWLFNILSFLPLERWNYFIYPGVQVMQLVWITVCVPKIQKPIVLPNKIWRARSFSDSSQNCTSSKQAVAHELHKRSCQSKKFSGLSRFNRISNKICCCLVDFRYPQCSLLSVLVAPVWVHCFAFCRKQ